MQKKGWQQPTLEVLDVNKTMAGPGIAVPDAVQPDQPTPDPDEMLHHS